MKPYVVVPSFNESENIPRLFEGLRAAQPGVEIILVDDGSPDGTAELARSISKGDVEVIERSGKLGLASAYVCGMRRALERGAERIVQMDADLSHDPRDVPRLLEVDANLVLGSRYVPGGELELAHPATHVVVLGRWSRAWLGLPYRDLTGGFKAWSNEALECALESVIGRYSFKWR